MLAAMRRAIACAALLAGCGDNNAGPDAPVTVIADAAPDAPVMPCTGGIELVGQFLETNSGSPPQIPVVMPTVGHPDGFDIRVSKWHVTHLGDTELVPDSAVTVTFTGYDAAALNANLAPLLTVPDIGNGDGNGALLAFPSDVQDTVHLAITTTDQTAIMDSLSGGLLASDGSGFVAIAPFSVTGGVSFFQLSAEGEIMLANGADGAMQLLCE